VEEIMYTEKYRPQVLEDYVGNKDIVKVASNWMQSWFDGKVFFPIMILHGRSGIGKTTLAICLGDKFNCAISEQNASDDRNVKQMKRIIQGTGITALDFNRRLTILDEADNLSNKSQRLLVDKHKLIRQPVIMLVNDMDKIIPELKKITLKLELRKPSLQQKLNLAKEIIAKERLELWDLKSIVEQSESFRDLLNNLFFDVHGLDFSDDTEGTKLELVGAMLRGEVGSERLRIAPDELLRFVYQNKIHSIMRDVDVYITIAERTKNYHMWAYAFALIEQHRFGGVINVPKFEFKKREKKVVKSVEHKVEGKSQRVRSVDAKSNTKSANSLFKHI